MRMLVTIPNSVRFPVGIFDYNTGKLTRLDWDEEWSAVARGVARKGDRFIFAVEERTGSCLYLTAWDGEGFTIPEGVLLEGIKDIHSIRWFCEVVFIVSSGNDNVYVFDTESREVGLIAGAYDNQEDTKHLNSIERWRGTWWVSCFGEKANGQWRGADKGGIWRLNPDKLSVVGAGKDHPLNSIPLAHPHNLFVLEDHLMVLESGTGSIRGALTCETVCKVPGYARGIAVDYEDRALYVGVSKYREQSKHTMIRMPKPVHGVDDYFPCGIFKIDIDYWVILEYKALPNPYADEIYHIELLD